MKTAVTGGNWTVAQPSGVRSIALAEGPSASSSLLGYLSSSGNFYVRLQGQPVWIKEAGNVTAISLAALGLVGAPLLGYVSQGSFYVADSTNSPRWLDEASGVSAIALVEPGNRGASPPRLPECHGRSRDSPRPTHRDVLSPGARRVRLALSSVTDS